MKALMSLGSCRKPATWITAESVGLAVDADGEEFLAGLYCLWDDDAAPLPVVLIGNDVCSLGLALRRYATAAQVDKCRQPCVLDHDTLFHSGKLTCRKAASLCQFNAGGTHVVAQGQTDGLTGRRHVADLAP